MSFSEDDSSLMVYYQYIDNHQIRINHDKPGAAVVYDLSTKKMVINP